MNFLAIKEIVEKRSKELKQAADNTTDTVYAQVSAYWNETLEGRTNFLSPEEFAFFRNPATNGTYGVGDYKHRPEFAQQFVNTIKELLAETNIPLEYFDTIAEPLVGAPEVVSFRNNLFSANFLRNIGSAWLITEKVSSLRPKRALRVCEIGGGYGATAYILHHMLEIESYTIIDLPENLYLSSIFLPLSLPGKSHSVLGAGEPGNTSCSSELNFALPGYIDAIEDAEYDLIINVASMGEMKFETSQAYVRWCRNHLSENGLFYFFNRHNVPKADGALNIDEFNLLDLTIETVTPMRRPASPANQVGYEIVMSKSDGKPEYLSTSWNALGHLIGLGFDESIRGLIDRFIEAQLSESDKSLLDHVWSMFQETDPQRKLDYLNNPCFVGNEHIRDPIRAALHILFDLSIIALGEKEKILAACTDMKLFVRLVGLYAEIEKKMELPDWRGTLEKIIPFSEATYETTVLLVDQPNSSVFAYRFRQDLYALER